MQFLKSLALAAVLMFAVQPAFAQSATNLSGVWQGAYWGGGQQVTTFQATLRDDPGPAFSGSTVEVNNFGAAGIPFLLATLQGEVRNGAVTFSKTYDGTGDQSHTVSYVGRLVSDRRIVGTWSIGSVTGNFELAR